MPPLVRQTRVLLLTQTWLLLVATLLLMLIIQAMTANGPLDDETTNDLLVLIGALLLAPILLSVSAKLFRHGRAPGWALALVAELTVAFVLYAATAVGLFFGLASLILAGVAAWVTVNLFRAEVRRFFFARGRVVGAEHAR
jgi:hypothetical protein